MRLKHLELQGYKTFASRTSFLFDGGITAIIGPNGSGKSNIADAIRWVLGEQSFRALRGKRTEDMIFSGSAQRARLGMASATLAFDNSDGWLPIDFGEVALTRRAYRSGENEYLINGRRVRLTDIVELLAKSGLAQRTYTVIGQGVVDAVLSLRPDDRRALFEEAAGTAIHRAKRTETLGRLDETKANLVRVQDIIAEISPRLQRLEKEAERARTRGTLEQELHGLQRLWYGYRWHQAQVDLEQCRETAEQREVQANREREALLQVQADMSELRVRQSKLRDLLGGWHRESSDLHRQMEQVQRDLAVWQERARLLGIQETELESEIATLGTRAGDSALKAEAAEQALEESKGTLAEKLAQLDLAQRELEGHEAEREEVARAIADAQAAVLGRSVEEAERRIRLAQVQEQHGEATQQAAKHAEATETLGADLSGLAGQLEAISQERSRLASSREQLHAEAAELQASLAAAQEELGEQRAALSRAQIAVQQAQERQEALGRQRREGEGLHAGVRAVLEASAGQRPSSDKGRRASPGLEGILGTVAQLIRVPEQYEVALEVALGGHLQDLVVESWSSAEAAIAYLREGNRGRATFLPLDTVRPSSEIEVPHLEGVVGCAVDLVQADARLERVVEMLLARTLVVLDLKTARRAFDRLQGGFQIVTIGGEVLRSSGSVTGGLGKGTQQSWALAREREWRDLPARLGEARDRVASISAALERASGAEKVIRERIATVEASRLKTAQAETAADAEASRVGRQKDRCEQQLGWSQQLREQAEARRRDLGAQETTLAGELSRLADEMRSGEATLAALREKLDALRGDALYLVLADARSAAAVARRNSEHRQSTVESLRERHQELLAAVQERSQRLTVLREERASLAQAVREKTSRREVIDAWLAALAQKTAPAEAEVAQIEADHDRLSATESTARLRLREAENRHSEAQLALSRADEERLRLRRQVMDDFGLVDMEPMGDQPDQPPLPLTELVSTLPVLSVLPPGLEEEMQQLRGQIKRLGPVNPSALAEYGEVRDRHAFLTGQVADLGEAEQRLWQVLGELDDVMRREFHRTFEAVQRQFQENFTRLFGGGSARLSLTDPDDLSATGVEISARPPGKRQQTLALLSGGERSLTAVALIFAFLQASPPPFCILDEVDAMLDEANVQRFRAMLKELAQSTQFIVVTHNRTTVQAADTIYGVTMGADSASQVVSLRLEGDHVATASGAHGELRAY
ncbi:MAG TPA: chromosome segregation protein SMC [Anaerolineae bacterium]|nr:chromosome segregation protein SMC [Anaerolineae bacterium]